MTIAPTEIIDPFTGMSNFDWEIEDGVEEKLKANPNAHTRYAGWNFNGRVWWDAKRELFACEVWRYGDPVQVVYAATLKEIMNTVSDEWGHE